MSPEDPGFVAYRLKQLEDRFDKMTSHVDSRFDSLQGTINTLAFIRTDVYERDQRSLAREMAMMAERVDSARALSMWALGTTLTIIAALGVLTAVVRLVAG